MTEKATKQIQNIASKTKLQNNEVIYNDIPKLNMTSLPFFLK